MNRELDIQSSFKREEAPLHVLLCYWAERQDVFKEQNNGIFFVAYCFQGVSLVHMHLCVSVHLSMELHVQAGSYLYHLFTFRCLYPVAIAHLSPALFWPASRSYWLCQVLHHVLSHYVTFTIKPSLGLVIFIACFIWRWRRCMRVLWIWNKFLLDFVLKIFSLILSFPRHPRHVPNGKKITLCAAHSYTSTVCAPVYVCVSLWALVQGYNVGLGMCRLTGTFTLSTVSACAANFSIWITEIHTNTNRMMALEKNDHMAEVGAEQPERSQVC